MTVRQGFTLIEILVVLVIFGIVATFTLPNLISSIEQSKAQAAQNTLLAISAAQQKYSEDHSGAYCLVGCGDSRPNINTNLSMGISSSDPFSYICNTNGIVVPTLYQCIATDNTDTLTLTVSALAAHVTCVGNPNQNYCPSISP